MNALVKAESTALSTMSEAELLKVLQTSLYPGAAVDSIKMVLGYCKAAGLDPMQKPVHIVPMWDAKAGQLRDVVMPGVNLYRTQAARSGECAGVTEPEFGPDTTETIGGQQITFPLWCRISVSRRLPTGEIVPFTAREFWKENYAVKGGKEKSIAPNAMWTKRPYGQIAKCAEAQALRKAFPEIASASTAEEMEGKAMRPEDAPAPAFDYLDPRPFIDGVAKLQTDAEAAAFWKEHAPKLQKQPTDYQDLKNTVIARRKAIAAAAQANPDAPATPGASGADAAAEAPGAPPASAPAPAADAPLAKTFAQVAELMKKAKTPEALDVAAEWIRTVADEGQRTELNGTYEQLKKGMEL